MTDMQALTEQDAILLENVARAVARCNDMKPSAVFHNKDGTFTVEEVNGIMDILIQREDDRGAMCVCLTEGADLDPRGTHSTWIYDWDLEANPNEACETAITCLVSKKYLRNEE